MEAFLVEFKAFVFAENQTEAMARVKVWRSLAKAAGYEPGPGGVKALADGELPSDVRTALDLERNRVRGVASDHARQRAIEGLASHLGGDLAGAGGLVASFEAELGGRIPTQLAHQLAELRKGAPE